MKHELDIRLKVTCIVLRLFHGCARLSLPSWLSNKSNCLSRPSRVSTNLGEPVADNLAFEGVMNEICLDSILSQADQHDKQPTRQPGGFKTPAQESASIRLPTNQPNKDQMSAKSDSFACLSLENLASYKQTVARVAPEESAVCMSQLKLATEPADGGARMQRFGSARYDKWDNLHNPMTSVSG